MADSKLRLQIVTALDAAGIKATQQQIDGLEKSLKRLNNSGGGGGSGNGPFKSWGKDFDSMLAKSTKLLAVARAIGTVANEVIAQMADGKDFGDALGDGLKEGVVKGASQALKIVGIDCDAILEAQKQKMKQHIQEIQQNVHEMGKKLNEQEQQELQLQKETHDRIIQSIKKENDAYKEQLGLVKEIHGQFNDVESARLERLKFEDITNLRREGGTEEQIQQLEKAWDVRIAMDAAERKVDSINLEQKMWEKENQGNQKALAQLEKRIHELEAQKSSREDQLQEWKSNKSQYQNNEDSKKLYRGAIKELNQYIKNADKELYPLYEQLDQLKNKMEVHGTRGLTFDIRRASAIEQSTLAVDKLAAEYDRHLDQMFDPLQDVVMNKEWGDYLLKSSQESYEALKETRDNTAELKDKLDELLQIKGG